MTIGKFVLKLPIWFEALLAGVLLATADSLVSLAQSGETVTWRTAVVAGTGAGADYLTSWYRERRAVGGLDSGNNSTTEGYSPYDY